MKKSQIFNFYSIISWFPLTGGKRNSSGGPDGAGNGSFQRVFVVLPSLMALIQTPMARQESCGPKSSGIELRRQSAPSLCRRWVSLHWCKLLFLITDTEGMQRVASSSEMVHTGSYLASCFTSSKQLLRNEMDLPRSAVDWHRVILDKGQTLHYGRISDSDLSYGFYCVVLHLQQSDNFQRAL